MFYKITLKIFMQILNIRNAMFSNNAALNAELSRT